MTNSELSRENLDKAINRGLNRIARMAGVPKSAVRRKYGEVAQALAAQAKQLKKK